MYYINQHNLILNIYNNKNLGKKNVIKNFFIALNKNLYNKSKVRTKLNFYNPKLFFFFVQY